MTDPLVPDHVIIQKAKEIMHQIKDRLSTLDLEERANEVKYRIEMKRIIEERRKVQDLCPHFETKHHYEEPTGGAESYTTCLLCKKEL